MTQPTLRTWLAGLLGCLVALLGAGKAEATHIVGGEFSLQYVRPFTYNLTLLLYFDAINGSPGAIDPSVVVYAFGKADNELKRTFVINRDPALDFVQYSNPDCQFVSGTVSTRIMRYPQQVRLDSATFSDPAGYYLVWERCCRNGVISNISDPGATGQTFYLEFPPVTSGGRRFVNSSPALFPPLSDFACVGQPFSFDFSGQDSDGDALQYRLVTPLRGNTNSANPGAASAPAPPIPAPYGLVNWGPGYSDAVQIGGAPPLGIDRITGLLQMRPSEQGLFVFAIECREFRDGRQIGLVRREFQVLVRDCPANTPPRLTVRDTAGNALASGDTLYVREGAQPVCVPVSVADSLPDTEVLSLRIPNIPAGVTISSTRGQTTLGGQFNTTLCVQPCLNGGTEIRYTPLTVRVRDNFCSIPARDSLRLVLAIIPRPPALSVIGLEGYTQQDTVQGDGEHTVSFLVADSTYPVTAQAFWEPAAPAGISLSRTGSGRRARFTVSYRLPCLGGGDTVRYRLVIVGQTRPCNITYADTLRMPITAYRRADSTLLRVLTGQGQLLQQGDTLRLTIGQASPLNLLGLGAVTDSSQVTVRAQPSPFLPGGRMLQAAGPGTQRLPLALSATCDLLPLGAEAGVYVLQLQAESEDCIRRNLQNLEVFVKVRDTASGQAILGNVITPNNDGQNDYLELANPKPIQNCRSSFEGMAIYNRWGGLVFETADVNFRWQPAQSAAGLYFYRLSFKDKTLKGWVEVVGN